MKQKSALGMADSDDEDEFALLTIDKKLDEIFGGRVQVKDPNAPILPNFSSSSKPALLPNPPQSEQLDLAMEIASKIVSSKNLTVGGASSIVGGGASLAAQEAASSIMKGEAVEVSGAALASQIAASINKKSEQLLQRSQTLTYLLERLFLDRNLLVENPQILIKHFSSIAMKLRSIAFLNGSAFASRHEKFSTTLGSILKLISLLGEFI